MDNGVCVCVDNGVCVCVCGQWCVCVCVCVCVNDREFSSVDLNLLLSVKSLGESQRCLHKEE